MLSTLLFYIMIREGRPGMITLNLSIITILLQRSDLNGPAHHRDHYNIYHGGLSGRILTGDRNQSSRLLHPQVGSPLKSKVRDLHCNLFLLVFASALLYCSSSTSLALQISRSLLPRLRFSSDLVGISA